MSNAQRLCPVRSAVRPAVRPANLMTPILDWHFKTGLRDYASGAAFDFARAGQAMQTLSDGSQILTGNNWPRNEAKGLLLEGSATNKVTCAKINPQYPTNITKSGDAAAVLSVVNDAVELAKAGLSAYGPNVYKLDNSAGTSGAFATCDGLTNNTNIHSLSVYARAVVYSASNLIRLTPIVTGASAIIPTGSYSRIKVENKIPSNTSSALEIRANPGSVVYFILPQLEEGPVCTSPIPGGTGAITRASEGADTSGNGLSIPLSQGLIDSLRGELNDKTMAWSAASGEAGKGPTTNTTTGLITWPGGTTQYSTAYKAGGAVVKAGFVYEINYTVSGCTGGNGVRLALGTTNGTRRTTDGNYTERLTCAGSDEIKFNALQVTGFSGSVMPNYVRRVLESGQTNPGEGTLLQVVALPYAAASTPNGATVPFLSVFNGSTSLAYIYSTGVNQTLSTYDYTSVGGLLVNSLSAGRYVVIVQYSAVLGKKRIGIYNPSTGALTWSNSTLAAGATYRGFFPIHSSNRLRFFYGGGAFPIYARALRCLPGITGDFETIYHAKEMIL